MLTSPKAWAVHLRRSRHIGDFRAWKDHDAYQRTLERLLRDLRVERLSRRRGVMVSRVGALPASHRPPAAVSVGPLIPLRGLRGMLSLAGRQVACAFEPPNGDYISASQRHTFDNRRSVPHQP